MPFAAADLQLAPGPPGEPLRYEENNETWLLVRAGRVRLHTSEDEQELQVGDLVCLPAGPAGTHALSNPGDTPARVLRLSTAYQPTLTHYPQHDTLVVGPDGRRYRPASEPPASSAKPASGS